MKKILYFCLLVVIIIAIIITNSYKITSNQYKISSVNEIYIYHSGYGVRLIEYKINLSQAKLYVYHTDIDNIVERNTSIENEGYQEILNIPRDKIESFLIQLKKHKFLNWRKDYTSHIMDGHEWGIIITFNDGNQKEIVGSNKYPKTWDKIYFAFEELTGKNILLFKSDWIKKQGTN